MVLYPILLSQSCSTTVPNFMLVSGIAQSGQNLALSRLAITTNVVVIMSFTSKNSTVFEACLIERIFVFKRMPKERQLRVMHIYKILSLVFNS